MIRETRGPSGRRTVPGVPLSLSDVPVSIPTSPPTFGEHTVAVLGELGFTAAEIEQLREGRVI
jgi:crotonobetainyl-CoA:carnitine CoA-transferase CaiB-like acyl-CoA transferase